MPSACEVNQKNLVLPNEPALIVIAYLYAQFLTDHEPLERYLRVREGGRELLREWIDFNLELRRLFGACGYRVSFSHRASYKDELLDMEERVERLIGDLLEPEIGQQFLLRQGAWELSRERILAPWTVLGSCAYCDDGV